MSQPRAREAGDITGSRGRRLFEYPLVGTVPAPPHNNGMRVWLKFQEEHTVRQLTTSVKLAELLEITKKKRNSYEDLYSKN